MPDICHRVGINAPIQTVYNALATREGLTEWWTRDVGGESAVGERLTFFFGSPEPGAVMEVTSLRAPNTVQWKCVEGPDDWKGTDLTFEVKEGDDETVVLFTHGGWREPVEFMYHCSTKWGYFLISLKKGLESGDATPYPVDFKLGAWG